MADIPSIIPIPDQVNENKNNHITLDDSNEVTHCWLDCDVSLLQFLKANILFKRFIRLKAWS